MTLHAGYAQQAAFEANKSAGEDAVKRAREVFISMGICPQCREQLPKGSPGPVCEDCLKLPPAALKSRNKGKEPEPNELNRYERKHKVHLDHTLQAVAGYYSMNEEILEQACVNGRIEGAVAIRGHWYFPDAVAVPDEMIHPEDTAGPERYRGSKAKLSTIFSKEE